MKYCLCPAPFHVLRSPLLQSTRKEMTASIIKRTTKMTEESQLLTSKTMMTQYIHLVISLR